MPRSRLPSGTAKLQLAFRGLSLAADFALLFIFLWADIRSNLFSIPAHIGLVLAYLIDIEEIVCLTNQKRTIRRWSTFWIILVDLMVAGWLLAGKPSNISWPTRDPNAARLDVRNSEFLLFIAYSIGLLVHTNCQFSRKQRLTILRHSLIHGMFVVAYAIGWVVIALRRRQGRMSTVQSKLDTLDRTSFEMKPGHT